MSCFVAGKLNIILLVFWPSFIHLSIFNTGFFQISGSQIVCWSLSQRGLIYDEMEMEKQKTKNWINGIQWKDKSQKVN